MLGRVLLRRGVPAIVRPVPRTIVLPIRSYATPGRPKSVVGEPSRPVKRAVKKAAAKPAAGTSPAEKKVAAKSKKTTPKKRQSKKLTEEETAALKEREAKAKAREQGLAEKEQLKELKKTALSPPKIAGDNPYVVFNKEKNKERGSLKSASESSTKETRLKTFTERVSTIAAEWKSLNAAEREHYNHVSRTMVEASQAEYKRWVESHSAEEIRLANRARRQLDRKSPTGKNKKSAWPQIKDERAVTRPASAYLHFSNNRQASGDFRHIPVPERVALISKEWRALSADEKEKYEQLHARDSARYLAEYQDTYQHPPPATKTSKSAAAAAA